MRTIRIGVAAPGSRIDATIAERVTRLADMQFGARATLRFHPQCFLASGHFAGTDEERADAFVELANDPDLDAVWIARGGYGACRIVPRVLSRLGPDAAGKTYLGYSDAGSLLSAVYGQGGHVAHGPMPADILREGGDRTVVRALSFLLDGTPETLEPSIDPETPVVAFNLTILCHLLGTPYEPDFSGHVIMLEEVSEHLYRIDRALCQLTRNEKMRRAAGFRLGRVSLVPPNEPEFGRTPEEIIRHWCADSGIPWLGAADIGHDADNKIVPFGLLRPWRRWFRRHEPDDA
ncbi:MAG TPA: LD-carboxypeptidase [Rhizomicrobium sp.]|nr:LD-carboxypeptidase [Rhizomicrobium sp.]